MVIGIGTQYRVRRCKGRLPVIWCVKKEQNGIRPCVLCNVNLCDMKGGTVTCVSSVCAFLFSLYGLANLRQNGSCAKRHMWSQSLDSDLWTTLRRC